MVLGRKFTVAHFFLILGQDIYITVRLREHVSLWQELHSSNCGVLFVAVIIIILFLILLCVFITITCGNSPSDLGRGKDKRCYGVTEILLMVRQ